MPKQYIYVDFDDTLCRGPFKSIIQCGEPVEGMCAKIKKVLEHGKYGIKVFSARFDSTKSKTETNMAVKVVQAWLYKQFGLQASQIQCTANKGMDCVEIWDNRAVGVEDETGRLLNDSRVLKELGLN